MKHVCQELKLPLAIASKTVGREVGRQDEAANVARVMEHWRKVWPREHIQQQKELLLVVALDDRPVPQDWVCVMVRSAAAEEVLGQAKRLALKIFDPARRVTKARCIARNLDVLVRGVAACSGDAEPDVQFEEAPECGVFSQRILCAFGVLVNRILFEAQEVCLEAKTEAFVPNVSHVLRGVFAHLRKRVGECGVRDVDRVLADAAACREVLGMLGKVPSFASRSSYEQHIQSQTMAAGRATSSSAELWQGRVIRVATWNIAGGQRSEEATERFSAEDQRAAVMHEIRWWRISYG